MGDLVEAGANGLLKESTFARCFVINDALHKTLDAERLGTVPDDGFGAEDIQSNTKSSTTSAAEDLLTLAPPESSSSDAPVSPDVPVVVGVPYDVFSAVSPPAAEKAGSANYDAFDLLDNSAPTNTPPPVPMPDVSATAPLDDFISSLSMTNPPPATTVTTGTGDTSATAASAGGDAASSGAGDASMEEIAVDDGEVDDFFAGLDKK